MPKPVGLERVIAQQDITDLCYRYAHGSDRVDDDAFLSTFWEDGGYGQVYADEPLAKIASVGGFMGKVFSCTQHLNCNILIDFIDHPLNILPLANC